MKVLTCALYLSALLILWRPLYSNFHRTRQFSFASGVISEYWHVLVVVVWLHLVLCMGEARSPYSPCSPSPSYSHPRLVSAFCSLLDECRAFHKDLLHREVLR